MTVKASRNSSTDTAHETLGEGATKEGPEQRRLERLEENGRDGGDGAEACLVKNSKSVIFHLLCFCCNPSDGGGALHGANSTAPLALPFVSNVSAFCHFRCLAVAVGGVQFS